MLNDALPGSLSNKAVVESADRDDEEYGDEERVEKNDEKSDQAAEREVSTRASHDRRVGIEGRQSLLRDIDLEEFAVLDGLLSGDSHVEDPVGGIMGWIEQLFLQSRSVDLGTFGGGILSSAFKSQSKKWPDMTTAYISKVVYVVHRFMVLSLSTLCRDEHIREEIWSDIEKEILQRYSVALDQAMFLVNIEREKRPFTLNHYFKDNLQSAQNERVLGNLRSKSRLEGSNWKHKKTHPIEYDLNLVVDVKTIQNETTKKSSLEQVKEKIYDSLQSYYSIARKRLVDNLYLQVVDHCLLTGPSSPLSAFSQEWVIKLDAERLETIAGGNSADKNRREALLKKIEDLTAAVRILKR
jgi:hypothetical protein